MANQHTKSGSGSAMLRWSMFGSRGPLLNLEGGGAGGGSQNQPPLQGAPQGGTNPSPRTEPQAQGGTVTVEQLNSMLENHGKQVHNQLFAELRKAGVFEKEPKHTGEPKPAAGAPPSALTAEDVGRMMMRRDELHAAIADVEMPATARARMVGDFARENPSDVSGWATKYAEDFGFKKKGATTMPSSPHAPTTPPVSNLGGPANPTATTEDTPLWRMSEADRNQLLKQKGYVWFRQKYYSDLRTATVKVRNY